jgi:hypothetical protein
MVSALGAMASIRWERRRIWTPYGSSAEVTPPDLSRTLERSSHLAVRQREQKRAGSGAHEAAVHFGLGWDFRSTH